MPIFVSILENFENMTHVYTSFSLKKGCVRYARSGKLGNGELQVGVTDIG